MKGKRKKRKGKEEEGERRGKRRRNKQDQKKDEKEEEDEAEGDKRRKEEGEEKEEGFVPELSCLQMMESPWGEHHPGTGQSLPVLTTTPLLLLQAGPMMISETFYIAVEGNTAGCLWGGAGAA